MSCYNHRNGFKDTLIIIKELDKATVANPSNAYLWETAVPDIPKELYAKIPFVKKDIKQ